MCVAIVKPVGVSLPNKERLKICFDNNPHSIGFTICAFDSNLKISMKFTDFDKFYYAAQDIILDDLLAFIHFRYATHGSVNLDNCQPFFISKDQDLIQESDLLMHNGVLNLGKLRDNKSDTLTLVEKIYKDKIQLDNDLITKSNNKIAIMHNNNDYQLFGKWIIGKDGCIYSNGSYRKSVEQQKLIQNNPNLVFCDCCGDIGENFLTTEVGYHFCGKCIKNKDVYLYNCRECGEICTDIICSTCSQDKNIGLKYWK